jgi:D-glycero-D-manno-heptose 1,7-bisphosphate phosphatase
MPLVILDRDGVINHDSDEYIKSEHEWRPIAGSLEAIAKLHRGGYQVVVATNQSGIARGYYSLETLAAIHAKMNLMVEQRGGRIDGIFYCPHRPDEGCECRKPKPGLLLRALAQFDADPAQTVMVGDSEKDVVAARAAGVTPVLVRSGKPGAVVDVEQQFDDLAAYVHSILGHP